MIVKYSAKGCLHLCVLSIRMASLSSSSNSATFSKLFGSRAIRAPLRSRGRISPMSFFAANDSTSLISCGIGMPARGFLTLELKADQQLRGVNIVSRRLLTRRSCFRKARRCSACAWYPEQLPPHGECLPRYRASCSYHSAHVEWHIPWKGLTLLWGP